MKFIREWLRVERPSGVATHASETIELERDYDAAFEQCIRGIEDVLGGAVRETDRVHGRIEATFGLIQSERLTCTLEKMSEARTRVVIESRRGASPEPAKPSQYVHTLAEFLQT